MPRGSRRSAPLLILPIWTLLVLGRARLLADEAPSGDFSGANLAPVPSRYVAGFEAVVEPALRAQISFLSSPELRGRESGDQGYDVASRYCATELQRQGVQPAGDEVEGGRSYFQSFRLVRWIWDTTATYLQLGGPENPRRVAPGEALAMPRTFSEMSWTGPWALLVQTQENADTPVRTILGNAGLEEHIPIVYPAADRPDLRKLGLGEADSPRAIVISDWLARYGRRTSTREVPEFREERDLGRDRAAPVAIISSETADAILAPYGLGVARLKALRESGTALPVEELLGLSMRIEGKARREVRETRNVVGRIEGADPERRDEFVAIGAHLDHVGTDGEDIFHGADDDASGSAGVLALGRAFALNPNRPARSVLLLLFAAEEKGLFGSSYFVEHAPVPIEDIVAYVNLDMIGRNEEKKDEPAEENVNTVHVVGSRRRSTEFHEIVMDLNRSVGLDFEFDQEDVYGRSDQFHFGRRGIPVVFFFTGFHPDYHRPTDTIEKINFPKLTRIVRLAYLVVHATADLPRRPRPGRLRAF